jgi:hypothetical protein
MLAISTRKGLSMAKGIGSPSIDFGIQTFISAEVGEGFVVGITGFYLLNVRSQVYYPGRITKAAVGAGGGMKGSRAGSISSPSMTFFRTSTPVKIEDFSGFATVASGEITPGIGYAEGFITFWGVDHDPYWIDIGSISVGLGIGASLSLLASVHFFDDPRRVVGSAITRRDERLECSYAR